MTHAIRETVRDFSQPLRPGPKRPFSESHIVRNLRSRQLDTVAEETGRLSPIPQIEHTAADGDDTEDSVYSSAASTSDGAPSSHTSVSTSPLLKSGVAPGNYPDPENISEATLTAHTYTAGAPPVDLLLRTSGVHRLSDFLLWQCHEHTTIVFLQCLWPAFDLWQFLPVLIEWQWKQKRRESVSTEASSNSLARHQKVH